MSWWRYERYVSAAEKRAKATRAAAKLSKDGKKLCPVKIAGRTIASTFWGKAWCDNLESYSDFENRLPRGRTYARNGSVLDLQIESGKITALVSGSNLYKVRIDITTCVSSAWKAIKTRCAGQIGSLVELLQGKLSKAVMDIVTQREGGLFPKPAEIDIECSCPDWAGLCKHAAAVLYGVGARLDSEPELLFKLRKVDHLDLITEAGSPASFVKPTAKGKKVLADSELSDVFGIELAPSDTHEAATTPSAAAAYGEKRTRRKPARVAAAASIRRSTPRGKSKRKANAKKQPRRKKRAPVAALSAAGS
jgi:uncharacterized Zn finger protein